MKIGILSLIGGVFLFDMLYLLFMWLHNKRKLREERV